MGAAARERARDVHVGAHRARDARRCWRRRAARGRGSLRDVAGALGDAEGRRHGRGDDGQQRARADLHRAVRAAAGRRGLRLAGRAGLDVRDPRRAGVGGAGRGRARDRARAARRGPSWRRPWPCGEDGCCWSASCVTAVAVLLREPIADLISVAGGVGGGRDARRPACLWLLLSRRARRAAGRARLQAGRVVDRARGGRAAGASAWCSWPPGWASPAPTSARRCRSLATAFGLWWIARARLGRRRPARRARRLRDLVGGAWPAVVGAVPGRAAPERRRDHGQAPDRRRRGGRLRGGRGGGQGGRLGRDRHRALPAARGDARRAPRAGPAARARARAGRRRRRRACRC